MGEMAEIFNGMRKHTQERKDKRSENNSEALQKLGIHMREQSKNVFRMETEWGAVMYYPGSNKWQHKGKTHRGDVNKLHAWLHSQGFLQ